MYRHPGPLTDSERHSTRQSRMERLHGTDAGRNHDGHHAEDVEESRAVRREAPVVAQSQPETVRRFPWWGWLLITILILALLAFVALYGAEKGWCV